MLSTIPSQYNSADSSQGLKSRDIELDCIGHLSSLISLDSVDNPLLKQTLENDATKRNILRHMKSECNRLYSFQNKWPLHNIAPESLAEAGFFYLQREDEVQCPFCEIIISKWTQDDKPLREHMKKSPKCPFLMGQEVGNIPLSEKRQNIINPSLNNVCSSNSVSAAYKPKHPRMSDVKRRLLTYSGWPLNEPGPQQLAECGLYYSGVADVVTCFFCGGTLGNWEPDDNPWLEHTKFFPECSFLELAKGRRKHSSKVKSCGKSIDQTPLVHNFSSDTNSEIVQQALDIFPKDLVLEAVKRRFGNPFSLQEICDDVLELKQKPGIQKSAPATTQQEMKTEIHAASNVDLLLCKVCMDRERGVVFQPCGHFVTCWNCSNLIADCPVCRRPIVHKIRTYIS